MDFLEITDIITADDTSPVFRLLVVDNSHPFPPYTIGLDEIAKSFTMTTEYANIIAVPQWSPIPLYNGWESYGGNFFEPSFMVDRGVLRLRGAVSGLMATLLTIGVLSGGSVPMSASSVSCQCSCNLGQVVTELRVNKNGNINLVNFSGLSPVNVVWLDGISISL